MGARYSSIKNHTDCNDSFAEFMRDYIELQPEGATVAPWCMSIEMLSQAYASFVMSVTKESSIMWNIEENTYKLLLYYLAHNKTKITYFGSVKLSGEPKITVAGIRLKKLPM